MNYLTTDQYQALFQLEHWYKKYSHQIIEISGIVGTGTWSIVQTFINRTGLDPREVMYLSHDQHRVIELASTGFHAYYINGIIYKYHRETDFTTIPQINPRSTHAEHVWEKYVRRKIDPRYRMIVVLDSSLIDWDTLMDIRTFGLPIILIRDPMLTPSDKSCTFERDPNIQLSEPHPQYSNDPIIKFAYRILQSPQFKIGVYDTVTVMSKKHMQLSNLATADMVLTFTDETRRSINSLYRDKILHRKDTLNIVGERLIIMNDDYTKKISNDGEKRVKLYLHHGLVGYINKINSHVPATKYVKMEFRPDFYFDSFTDVILNRYSLNNINAISRQIVPYDIVEAQYAYALPVLLARCNHWDKVTIINDLPDDMDPMMKSRLLYTAITRSRQMITLLT